MMPLNWVEQRLQKEKAKDSDGEQNALQSCQGGTSFNFSGVETRRRHVLSYFNHPAAGAGSPTLLDLESSFLKA